MTKHTQIAGQYPVLPLRTEVQLPGHVGRARARLDDLAVEDVLLRYLHRGAVRTHDAGGEVLDLKPAHVRDVELTVFLATALGEHLHPHVVAHG